MKRGDVYLVSLDPVVGSETGKPGAAIVVQNETGNAVSPMTIVVPLTDPRQYKNLPVQVLLTRAETGLPNKDSCVECGHVTTIDRAMIVRYLPRKMSDSNAPTIGKKYAAAVNR